MPTIFDHLDVGLHTSPNEVDVWDIDEEENDDSDEEDDHDDDDGETASTDEGYPSDASTLAYAYSDSDVFSDETIVYYDVSVPQFQIRSFILADYLVQSVLSEDEDDEPPCKMCRLDI